MFTCSVAAPYHFFQGLRHLSSTTSSLVLAGLRLSAVALSHGPGRSRHCFRVPQPSWQIRHSKDSAALKANSGYMTRTFYAASGQSQCQQLSPIEQSEHDETAACRLLSDLKRLRALSRAAAFLAFSCSKACCMAV